jgi:hypothetical protein
MWRVTAATFSPLLCNFHSKKERERRGKKKIGDLRNVSSCAEDIQRVRNRFEVDDDNEPAEEHLS